MTKKTWRSVYAVQPLIDGEQYFPALLKACAQATHSIHLLIYWFESGQVANLFIAVLEAACARGVNVTCLLDEIGSLALSKADRQRLMNAGVLLGWYNPIRFERLHFILQRDHSKLVVIDNQTLFIGGTGLADIFAPEKLFDSNIKQHNELQHVTSTARVHWRENMFQLSGNIVEDALISLQQKWQDAQEDQQTLNRPAMPNKLMSQPLSLTTFNLFTYNPINLLDGTYSQHNNLQAKWIESKGQHQRQILKAVIRDIRQSQKRVFLVTAYFAPDPLLRHALKRAVQRGVTVTILIPGARADHPLLQKAGQYYYQKLLVAGVHIYEYLPCFMHSKLIICDNLVYFGSSNLDIYTQRWSLEANIVVNSNHFANTMVGIVQQDLQNSEKITLEYWIKRQWWRKLASLLAYKIGCWADFLARQIFLFKRNKRR